MTSPFLNIPPERHIASNDLAFAIRDGFPVSAGHTLVITRRVVATWFDASENEQHALLRLVAEVRRQLEAELHPDGYNVGWNVDMAGGQTVPHLHVHVIPRFHGDVPDPRGGVRHVIPGKGNYLAPGFAPAGSRQDALTTGGQEDPLLLHLQPLFARAQDIRILAAFVQQKGVEELEALVSRWSS